MRTRLPSKQSAQTDSPDRPSGQPPPARECARERPAAADDRQQTAMRKRNSYQTERTHLVNHGSAARAGVGDHGHRKGLAAAVAEVGADLSGQTTTIVLIGWTRGRWIGHLDIEFVGQFAVLTVNEPVDKVATENNNVNETTHQPHKRLT